MRCKEVKGIEFYRVVRSGFIGETMFQIVGD